MKENDMRHAQHADEIGRLEGVAGKSVYAQGANAQGIHYGCKILKRHLVNGSVLELGPAEGLMTAELYAMGLDLTCVDGSKIFCDLLKEKFPGLAVVNQLFEDFKPVKLFDNIILGHVLEHVESPVAILSLVRQWLAPAGVIFAAVPNARSLHRQAAVVMGILDAENALNDTDRHHGHRRVFYPESFRQVFLRAALKIDHFGGYWLKPVSSGQIEQTWTDTMLDAFMQLGERYPDIAGEIYVIASRNS